MKKTTAALLSFALLIGVGLTYEQTEAISWSQKRENNEAIQDAIQTRQNNYYRNILRREKGIKNRETLKTYHNNNIWKNYVSRRSTELDREGEMSDRKGIRENTGYVNAANNSKMTMRKGWVCYLLQNEAPGEDCYTMGQIDGDSEGRISTRMNRMREADVAAIVGAVRDLTKAAMHQNANENTLDRPSTYTPGNSQRYFKSPFQKQFEMPEDLDI